MKDISILLDEIAVKDEKINRLIQTNNAVVARRNLAVGLAMRLLQEGELAGSDWDYIDEQEVKDIDALINELKEKAFIDGALKMAKVAAIIVDEVAFRKNISTTAKMYAEHRDWHD